MILAIDPGREKCGVALLEKNGQALLRQVTPRKELAGKIRSILADNPVEVILIGGSTAGRAVADDLARAGIRAVPQFIAEKDSSREARERYWRENPPAGLWRFFPVSLRTPPRPIDDIAAQILGERYLGR